MTGLKELLKHLQPTCPDIISLPNGSKVVGVELGSVCLGQNFIVHNILYIPNLNYIFILLGQLMNEANYFITLSTGLCVMQDHILRMPIGMGERKNGIILYRLLKLSQFSSLFARSA